MPNHHNKPELSIGYPGDVAGQSNIQRSSSFHTNNFDTLASTTSPLSGWRVTLDSGQWYSWNVANWQRCGVCVAFGGNRPGGVRCVVLESDGRLRALDGAGEAVWQRGPFGPGDRWKLTVEEGSGGDVVLRNAAGEAVWSASVDTRRQRDEAEASLKQAALTKERDSAQLEKLVSPALTVMRVLY